jgi:hypothetical protein
MTDGSFEDRLKERYDMRIRHDVVFISSVLFTIALVFQIRWAWWNALAGYDDARGPDLWRREALHATGRVGELMLALILIGLIVTWTGYLKKVPWAWFVMFAVVSSLAIQLGILPLMVHPRWMVEATSDLFLETTGKQPAHYWGMAWDGLAWRGIIEPISIFLLMAIALLLPVKSFFFRRASPAIGSHL